MDIREYILSKFPGKIPNTNNRIHASCPFHDDKNPSFSINVENGLFICGSRKCGVRGNFMLFYKMMEGIEDWKEVYKRVKKVTISRDFESLFNSKNKKEVIEPEIHPFPEYPFISGIDQLDYFSERNIEKDVWENFGVVYGVDGLFSGINICNSIVIPIFDVFGKYLTFQIRKLSHNSSKRWINPTGSPIQYHLYGGWNITGLFRNLWIVEGASDVWRLYSKGIEAVGLFTKEASVSQLNVLNMLCHNYGCVPIVCLDGDTVPENVWIDFDHATKLKSELMAFGLDPIIVRLDKDKDPANLSDFEIETLKFEVESENGSKEICM